MRKRMAAPVTVRATFACLVICLLLALACCGGSGGGGGGGATTGTLSGTVTFDFVPTSKTSGLVYTNTTQKPARGVVVEAVNDDTAATAATTVTDGTGAYSFTLVAGNYRIRVKAQMKTTGPPTWDVQVVDNTQGQALYALESTAVQVVGGGAVTKNLNAPSGWGGASYTGTRSAAPFAILDTVYKSIQKVVAVNATAVFPQLLINWSVNNRPTSGDPTLGEIGTSYYDATVGVKQIYLLGKANIDTDEYDDHVIAHEWGHYFEDRFSRSDNIGGSHSLGNKLDPRVAFSEGFCDAMSGMTLNNSDYIDTAGLGQALVGVYLDLTDPNGDPASVGWFSEDSVLYILYAFYQQLGFQAIHDVMVGSEKTTPAFTTIYSFSAYLKASNPARVAAINAFLAAKNISTTAVDEFDSTATETNDGGDPKSLPVYTKLTKGAAAVSLCVNNAAGNVNRLRNHKYFTFTVAVAGNYTFNAATGTPGNGARPNIAVFLQGTVEGETSNSTAESISLNASLPPGTYVGEVYDYRYRTTTTAPTGEVCYNVTLN